MENEKIQIAGPASKDSLPIESVLQHLSKFNLNAFLSSSTPLNGNQIAPQMCGFLIGCTTGTKQQTLVNILVKTRIHDLKYDNFF